MSLDVRTHQRAPIMARALTTRQRALKRGFDLSISAVGLALLWPLLIAVALVVKATSPGPVFFRHRRVGRNAVVYEVLKFRTMSHTDRIDGLQVTVAGDARITAVGRRLRRWKLDELPQLWNVLRGHMSIVGPRPDVPGYADRLTGDDARLLQLRPGITGPATLCFRREEELLATVDDPAFYYDTALYPIKVQLDLRYLADWSVWRDVGYIAVTLLPWLDRWLHLVPSDLGTDLSS